VGRNGLAQKPCEAEDRGGGIVLEITLRKRPELHEACVVRAQKGKIGRRLQLPHPTICTRLFIRDMRTMCNLG
jgi:hypothetical protein